MNKIDKRVDIMDVKTKTKLSNFLIAIGLIIIGITAYDYYVLTSAMPILVVDVTDESIKDLVVENVTISLDPTNFIRLCAFGGILTTIGMVFRPKEK